jgi:hypothetical protein
LNFIFLFNSSWANETIKNEEILSVQNTVESIPDFIFDQTKNITLDIHNLGAVFMYKYNMMVFLKVKFYLLIVMLHVLFSINYALCNEIDPIKAVSMMKSLESSVSTMSWSFFVGDINADGQHGRLDSSTVLVDVQTMHYRIGRKIVTSNRKTAFSYDGQSYMSYMGSLSDEVGNHHRHVSLGIISKNADDIPSSQILENNWSTVGIFNGIPCLFVPLFSKQDSPAFFHRS